MDGVFYAVSLEGACKKTAYIHQPAKAARAERAHPLASSGLFCALPTLVPTSELGQTRRFGDIRITSALPLRADIHRKGRHVRKAPISDIDHGWRLSQRGS